MKIEKKHNHDHFWVEDGILYESYRTIRGLRYMLKLEVPTCPDIERCSEKDIENIINNLKTKSNEK